MLTRASLSNIEVNVFSDASNGRAWNLHRLPGVLKRKGRRIESSLDLDEKFTDQPRVEVKADVDE